MMMVLSLILVCSKQKRNPNTVWKINFQSIVSLWKLCYFIPFTNCLEVLSMKASMKKKTKKEFFDENYWRRLWKIELFDDNYWRRWWKIEFSMKNELFDENCWRRFKKFFDENCWSTNETTSWSIFCSLLR
jgi:hypothetical protein